MINVTKKDFDEYMNFSERNWIGMGYPEYEGIAHKFTSAIEKVINIEKLKDYDDLVINIEELVAKYNEGGSYEKIGKENDYVIIEALLHFLTYLILEHGYKLKNENMF